MSYKASGLSTGFQEEQVMGEIFLLHLEGSKGIVELAFEGGTVYAWEASPPVFLCSARRLIAVCLLYHWLTGSCLMP